MKYLLIYNIPIIADIRKLIYDLFIRIILYTSVSIKLKYKCFKSNYIKINIIDLENILFHYHNDHMEVYIDEDFNRNDILKIMKDKLINMFPNHVIQWTQRSNTLTFIKL